MKERRNLIVLFYILVCLQCICHMILYVDMDVDPDVDPFIYDDEGFTFYEFAELLGDCSMLALGWLVTATMFQLTLSIKVILNEEKKDQADRYTKYMYITAGTVSSL